MTKAERTEKITFLQKLEAGLVTVEDLKPAHATVIVKGDLYNDDGNNIYHINGTSLFFTKQECDDYTESMRAVIYLPDNKRCKILWPGNTNLYEDF